MTDLNISPSIHQGLPAVPPAATDPAKVREAAQQFEALLLGQLLSSAREGGWLGSGEDSSSSCANDLADEQLATMLARKGGLGLSQLISEGLERRE